MTLQAPSAPALHVLPLPSRASAEMHVYFDYPDAQPWLGEAVGRAAAAEDFQAMHELMDLGTVGWGAPHGQYCDESMRVARATGVVLEQVGEDGLQPTGAALAHARCWAYWREAEEGAVLVLEVQAPRSYGWGLGKDAMAQAQLQGSCLRQMRKQIESLLENVAEPETAQRLEIVFSGDWDESLAGLRNSLQLHALTTWQEVLAAEESADAVKH